MENLLHRVQGAVQGAVNKVTGHHGGEGQQQGQAPVTTQPSSEQPTQQPSSTCSLLVQHDITKKQFLCKCPNDADAYLDYTILAQEMEGKPCVDLKYIFVPVEQRSKGVGKCLVMEFLRWAKASNYCVHVNPEVRPFLQDAVFDTSEFKTSGWRFESEKQLLVM